MTMSVPQDPSTHRARVGVSLGIAVLVLTAYALPVLGFLASLSLPFVTHAARRHLWPAATRASSVMWSLLGWAGLWLPALLSVVTLVSAGSEEGGGLEASTVWLVLPLCSPNSLDAVLLPALAAAATCLVGLLGTVASRRGWPWVAAAWLAPWVHYVVFVQMPHDFFC